MREKLLLACLLGAVSLFACGGSAPRPDEAVVTPARTTSPVVETKMNSQTLARSYVEKLAAGQHAEVYAQFDDTMKGAMTLEQLGALWPGLVSQTGALERVVGMRTEKRDQLEVIIVTCQFEKAWLDVRVAFGPERKITGLFVRPTDRSDAWRPASYADMEAIDEVELSIGQAPWDVPATLSSPKAMAGHSGKCPGVVLVHGSGPNDRDETIGPNKPFKDLALGLASRGVCVLRYEKRTKHHAKLVMETIGDTLTVKEETVDDALAAASALRKQAMVDPDRVFVLGHSLGGYAIPRIAKRNTGLRGFIVLAGSTRPLEDLVLEQVTYIANVDGKISPSEQQAIATIRTQVAVVKALTPGSTNDAAKLLLGIGPTYWLDLKAHDPIKLIASETRPILVLQGDRDYQVTLADFAGWQRALQGKAHAKLKRYAKLNHLFIPGEGMSTPAEYQQPGHVALEVIEDVAAFVNEPLPAIR